MTATTSSTSKYLDLNPLVPLQIPSNLSWTDAEKSQLSILYPSVDVRARIVVQYLLDVRLWLHFLVTKYALITAYTYSSVIHCLNFFRRKELMASFNYSRFGPYVPDINLLSLANHENDILQEENNGKITEPAVASLMQYASVKASHEVESLILESTILSVR